MPDALRVCVTVSRRTLSPGLRGRRIEAPFVSLRPKSARVTTRAGGAGLHVDGLAGGCAVCGRGRDRRRVVQRGSILP